MMHNFIDGFMSFFVSAETGKALATMLFALAFVGCAIVLFRIIDKVLFR